LFSTWCQHLTAANIQYRADIARTEYLSNSDERLRWQANALPTESISRLSTRLPTFRKLFEKIRGMPEQQGSPDQNVPQLWDESKALDPASAVIHQLLLIQAFRPALVTLL